MPRTHTRNPPQLHIQLNPRLAQRAAAEPRRRRISDHLRAEHRAVQRQIVSQPVGGAVPAQWRSRSWFVGWPQLRRWEVAARHHPARPHRLRQADQPCPAVSSTGQAAQSAFAAAIAWVSFRSASNSCGCPRQAAPCKFGRLLLWASSSSSSAITESSWHRFVSTA